MKKYAVDTFNDLREQAIRLAADAMGIDADTQTVVPMDERSHQLAADDVFNAFQRGDVDRATIDRLATCKVGDMQGQVHPAFQAEIVLRLHRLTGRGVC